MALKINATEVWAADLDDLCDDLAEKLARLAEAGASPECVVARRHGRGRHSGDLFVTPLTGSDVQAKARSAGFEEPEHVSTLRVEGPNEAGFAASLVRVVAGAGVGLRSFVAVAIRRRMVCFLGFARLADAAAAMDAIRALGPPKRRSPSHRRET